MFPSSSFTFLFQTPEPLAITHVPPKLEEDPSRAQVERLQRKKVKLLLRCQKQIIAQLALRSLARRGGDKKALDEAERGEVRSAPEAVGTQDESARKSRKSKSKKARAPAPPPPMTRSPPAPEALPPQVRFLVEIRFLPNLTFFLGRTLSGCSTSSLSSSHSSRWSPSFLSTSSASLLSSSSTPCCGSRSSAIG